MREFGPISTMDVRGIEGVVAAFGGSVVIPLVVHATEPQEPIRVLLNWFNSTGNIEMNYPAEAGLLPRICVDLAEACAEFAGANVVYDPDNDMLLDWRPLGEIELKPGGLVPLSYSFSVETTFPMKDGDTETIRMKVFMEKNDEGGWDWATTSGIKGHAENTLQATDQALAALGTLSLRLHRRYLEDPK